MTLATPSSVVYGQSATFTATVTGYGTPIGTVTFYAGPVNPADEIGTASLAVVDGEDQATVSDSALSVSSSPYLITAVYSGDTDNQGNTSAAVTLSITQAATSTAVTPGSATVSGGQSATFTATVSSAVVRAARRLGTVPGERRGVWQRGVALGRDGAARDHGERRQLHGRRTVHRRHQLRRDPAGRRDQRDAHRQSGGVPCHQPGNQPEYRHFRGITDTGAVTFTGNLSAAGMTVDVFDTTTNKDLGDATVTGTAFSLALNLAEGSHVLRARAMLNGAYADAFFTVLVDLTPPTSHVVNSLGTTQSSDTFPVSVTFSDPAGSGARLPPASRRWISTCRSTTAPSACTRR